MITILWIIAYAIITIAFMIPVIILVDKFGLAPTGDDIGAQIQGLGLFFPILAWGLFWAFFILNEAFRSKVWNWFLNN
jgi:hypothetical protein